MPPICYRVIDSYLDCASNAIEYMKIHNPSMIPTMQQGVVEIKHARNQMKEAVKNSGEAAMTEECNGKMRAQILDAEQSAIISMGRGDGGRYAEQCLRDMNGIR